MEAKAKVKDIAISRERVTLRDVLHEGTCLSSVGLLSFALFVFLLMFPAQMTNKMCKHEHKLQDLIFAPPLDNNTLQLQKKNANRQNMSKS